jgi:hypothetical protein
MQISLHQALGVLGLALALVESTPKRESAAAVGEGAEDLAAEGETGGVALRSCVLVRRACHRPAGSKPATKGDWSQGGGELFFNKAFGSASREAEAGAAAVLGAVP